MALRGAAASRGVVGLVLAALLAVPALAVTAPASQDPILPLGGDGFLGADPRVDKPVTTLDPAERLVPRPPGTVVTTTLLFGPFGLPAGWDFTRLHLDVQLPPGFLTRVDYRVVDAATGEQYNNMQVHIHHGLWYRLGGHAQGQFLFGTGEEYTHLDLDARSDAVPDGPRYGVGFRDGQGLFIVLMLHNKQSEARVVKVLVDVTYVFGTTDDIRFARDCGEGDLAGRVFGAEGCVAGALFHNVNGYLWGDLFNVPRQAQGDGVFIYPLEGTSVAPHAPDPPPWLPLPPAPGSGVPGTALLVTHFTAPADGIVVHAVGHVHQSGLETVVVNQGPEGSPCGDDLDHDGLPGITLFRSRKLDRVAGPNPDSEDFQMGVTQPGFRAPIRAGDRIAEFGIYANRDHAAYQAMTFAAMHVDEDTFVPPRNGPCGMENTAPVLADGAPGDPTVTILNRPWTGAALPVCGTELGAPSCDLPPETPAGGLNVYEVVIAGFTYIPGDMHLTGALGAPPKIPRFGGLRFVNADTGSVVRHTVTSCAWPCNGPYRANYPLPDGRFDSDRLGNLDYFDGGSIVPNPQDDAVWRVPTMQRGLYSYYCRIHPEMRGWFELV